MEFKTIQVNFNDDTASITVTEKRIYLGITDIFRDEILDVLQNNKKELVINLENVAVMNSAGLGVLIMARDMIKKKSGRIKLTNLQPLMQDIFSRMRLDTLFEINGSPEQAFSS